MRGVKQWKSFFEYVKKSGCDIYDTTCSMQTDMHGIWDEGEGRKAFSSLDINVTEQDACNVNFVYEYADDMRILMKNGAFSEVSQSGLFRKTDLLYELGEVAFFELDAMKENK